VALPESAKVVLQGLHCDLVDDEDVEAAWLTTLTDRPRPGAVREPVLALAELAAKGRSSNAMA
jgi:hypothetical protein